MPLSPSDLSSYDLKHRNVVAIVRSVLGEVVIAPDILVAIVTLETTEGRTTSPRFASGLQINDNAILFEPHELPTILRDMLWPREVPAEVAAPVEPPAAPFPTAGNIDDEPVPAGSSDYDGPAF